VSVNTAGGTPYAPCQPLLIRQTNARQRSLKMVEVASSIRLEAIPGKEKEVEQFLLAGLVRDEPGTIA